MRKQIFGAVTSLIILLAFAACAGGSNIENSSTESFSVTASQSDTPESSTAVLQRPDPFDDPQYKMLYYTKYDLLWHHTVISLDSMLSQFDDYILRDELEYPYAKVYLQSGNIGFLFYDKSRNLTDIWPTDHFLTQQEIDRLVVGKTTTREVIEMDLCAIGGMTSYEDISAHYLPDGVYVIRCSYDGSEGMGLVTSIEFFSNEDIHEQPIDYFSMTVPYILPCDRNMERTQANTVCK